MSRRRNALALLALGGLFALVLIFATDGRSASTAALHTQIRQDRVQLWHSRGTVRFFLHGHPILLYKWKTKQIAHRELRKAESKVAYWSGQLQQDTASLMLATDPTGYVQLVIRQVFGPYGDQAIGVSGCETGHTWSLSSQNGQYLGLFQMGSWERATYAYGRYATALDQARAAYRYFIAGGRDWHQWQCKPDGSLRW